MKLNPSRLPNESYEDYKARRVIENKWVRQYLKGRLIWNGGTYTKPKEEQQ